jgi:1-acyl-sn-glycerol-3-phosphate acyltransferase
VTPSILSFPKRAFVVTGPEAVSIKGIRTLVQMLGAIPLPSSFPGWKKFMKSMQEKTEKHTVMIYPEAHIWPYYTGIRPFGESSFKYPFQMKRKVVANVITYRQRKIFKNTRPLVTATLSDPFDPSCFESPKALRDAVYGFMAEAVSKDNYAYWEYRQEAGEEAEKTTASAD